MSNSSVYPIDRILSGAYPTASQSGPRSDGKKGYSTFPRTPVPSDCLVSNPGHPWGSLIRL